MKLQWILLALFLIAMVRNIAKAMRNPMLKNFLRLISILVAFIITFILQVCGVFQNIAEKIVDSIDFAAMAPEFSGTIGSAIGFIIPFCTTLISPLLFVLVFAIILLVLRIIHVNLVYKFIVKRKRRKEIKEFKQALKEEKMMLKKAISDNEGRFQSIMESIAIANPDIDAFDYESLDEDEIDRMVEQRIKLEKKKKKKAGFFKESSERKALSIVCGVVSGFLLFGITWMGMFYTMDFLSDVTDGIKNTNADDTKIYQIVEIIDDHLVTPYEESFVYKLYDSMAMVDLMNFTVKAGGKVGVDEQGAVIYADDIMRDHMMRAVRLACEITSAKSEQEHVGEDISAIIKNPSTVSLMADIIIDLIEDVEIDDLDSDNPLNSLLSNIIDNYKGEGNKDRIVQDLGAMSDLVVLAAKNRLLAKIISDTTDINALFENRDMIKDLSVTMSHLSFYGSTMESAFMLGIDSVGPMLMPANNAEAYEKFVANIVDSANGIAKISNEDLTYLYAFIKNAATYEKSDNNTSEGVLGYIADPLYRAEKLKDKVTEFKDRGEQIKADGEQLIADGDALKTDAEKLQADADALTTELTAAATEIAALELKKETDPDNFTLEDQARLDYFYDISEQKDDFIARAEDLKKRGEDLKAQGEALKKQAEDLANDVSALYEEAKALVSDFEERIKGFTPFISYFMNWNSVQKPFMLANEDCSTACLALNIDGNIYYCTTDVLDIETLVDFVLNDDAFDGLGNIVGGSEEGDGSGDEGSGNDGDGEEDSLGDDILDITVDKYLDKIPMKELIEMLVVSNDTTEMDDRISELTDLVNYIIFSANSSETEMNDESLYLLLCDYIDDESNLGTASYNVATKIVNSHGNHSSFDYNGVTVEKMKAEMHFGDDEWTLEYKESDSEQLVDIIFTLLDLMEMMNSDDETEGEASSNTDMEALLGLLVTIGKTMDQMTNTYCLKGVPAIMVEGILKNDMLSMAITPSMLYGENGYMSRLESGELTYEALMTEISDMASDILGKLNGKEVSNQ